jgi:EpsI family protein
MKTASIRYVMLIVVVFAIGALVNTWAYLGEAHIERKELKDFPDQIGDWTKSGADQVLDAPTLQVLRASDYLLRDFRKSDGQSANLYIGYYLTQRDGASYHSPLNCLPGSGWTLNEPGKLSLPGPNGSSFMANKYVIENGDQKSLMLYWYQGRGRAVASEYWGKIYTVIDSVRLRRSDGAMVRITVPVDGSEAKALNSATEIAVAATAALPDFVPN